MNGIEPHVALQGIRNDVLGALFGDGVIVERGGVFFQVFFREADSDFADALELIRASVVACEEVGVVNASSYSFVMVYWIETTEGCAILVREFHTLVPNNHVRTASIKRTYNFAVVYWIILCEIGQRVSH